MNKKRGRCPSLIGGTHGSPSLEVAKGKRTCKRCDNEILKDSQSVVVPTPGSMGRKVYCLGCMTEIIAQTRKDVDVFEESMRSI